MFYLKSDVFQSCPKSQQKLGYFYKNNSDKLFLKIAQSGHTGYFYHIYYLYWQLCKDISIESYDWIDRVNIHSSRHPSSLAEKKTSKIDSFRVVVVVVVSDVTWRSNVVVVAVVVVFGPNHFL